MVENIENSIMTAELLIELVVLTALVPGANEIDSINTLNKM